MDSTTKNLRNRFTINYDEINVINYFVIRLALRFIALWPFIVLRTTRIVYCLAIG